MSARVGVLLANYHRFTGAQRSLCLLLEGLRSVEPIVFSPGEGAATEAMRARGIAVEVVESPAALREFGGGLLRAGLARRLAVAATAVLPFSLALRRRLARSEIRLLHANDARGVLIGAPAAKSLGLPVVWHVRGDARRLGALYQRAAGLLSDRIVCVADAVTSSLLPGLQAKCTTVYNGVPPIGAPPRRDRATLAASVGLAPETPLVVAVGSIVPFKGLHHAIAALRRVPGAALVFVGDRTDEAYARHLDGMAGPNVRFPGWDAEAFDWIRAADVVILPTVERETFLGRDVRTSEGLSRTVLEAMSAGRAIVATRVAGAAEQIVDGQSGLLVPPSDPDALGQALAKLLADASLRDRLGQAAARRATERFSLAAMVAGTEAVYGSLLGRV
jgi:glycosyltransferase involved in cell wall biosynthesis